MDVPLVRVKGEGGKNRPREKGGGKDMRAWRAEQGQSLHLAAGGGKS